MFQAHHVAVSDPADGLQFRIRRMMRRVVIVPALALALAAAMGQTSVTHAQSEGCGAGVIGETIMVYNTPGMTWVPFVLQHFPMTAQGLRDAVEFAALQPMDLTVAVPAGTYDMGSSPLVIPAGPGALAIIGNGGQAGQNVNGGPTTVASTGNFALVGSGLTDVTISDIAFLANAAPGTIDITSSANVALTCLYASSMGTIVNLDGNSNRIEDSHVDGFNGSSLIAVRLSGSSAFVSGNLIRSNFQSGIGVYLAAGSHSIVDNDVHHGEFCVKGEPGSSAGLADNVLHNCFVGAYLNGDFNSLNRNTIQGPYLRTGIELVGGAGNAVVDNDISSPDDFGIRLSGATGSTIRLNSMWDGTYGIYLASGSDNNSIQRNRIASMSYPSIGGTTNGNTIFDNAITCTGGGVHPAIRFTTGNGNAINYNAIAHWRTSPESEVIKLPAGHTPSPMGNTITLCTQP